MKYTLPTWTTTACALLFACTNNPYSSEAAGGKVLYSSYYEAPRTLDPAVAYSTTDHAMLGKVYDSLLEYHYLKRPYTLIPALAKAVPSAEHLPGGRVRYRFEIREDLLFQDDPCFELSARGQGTRSIVASDFAFELMRLADPAVGSPVGEPFSNLLGFRAFSEKLAARRKADAAFAALPAAKQYPLVGGIEGVSTPSDHILDIVLSQPYPQILYWFAMAFTTPMPWEAVTYYDGKNGHPPLAEHPVGAGAYQIQNYDKQSRVVFVKNPNWYGIRHPEWKAPAATYPSEGEPGDAEAGRLRPQAVGHALPFIDRIEYYREKEHIPAFNKFLQGYYDASPIAKESFEHVIQGGALSADMASKGMQLAKSVVPATYYIGFNMEDRVVGAPGGERSRKLRQAMSLVVDSNEFTRLFLNGRGIAAQSVIAPGIFGYEPEYRNPFRTVDVARAKRLLAEAGYPDGMDPKTHRPLHLTFDTGDTATDSRLQYQFFVNAWRQIGLDVEIAATNYNRFQAKVRQGAYQIFYWGWVADYPDPENFMFLLWSEMARSKEGGPNTANYANPKFDALFVKMKTMANGPERLNLIRQMVAILQTDRPWIELFHPESYVLFHGWLKNVKPVGLTISIDKYYDLSPSERATYRSAWNRPILWPVYVLLALLVLLVVPAVRTVLKERQ